MLLHLLRSASRSLAVRLEWSSIAEAPRASWDKLLIVDLSAEAEKYSEQNLATVQKALEFIALFDDRTSDRIQKAIRRIIITELYKWRGEYRHEYEAAVVNVDLVRSGQETEVALLIIHESAHAYLHRLGFTYQEGKRQQIERICRRAEIAFLRKVPGNHARIKWLRDRFMEAPFSDAELHLHMRRQVLHRLERLDAPKWIIGWLRRRTERVTDEVPGSP